MMAGKTKGVTWAVPMSHWNRRRMRLKAAVWAVLSFVGLLWILMLSACTTPALTVVQVPGGGLIVRRVGYQPGREEVGGIPSSVAASQPIYRADHGVWEGLALVAPFMGSILRGGQ